MTNAVRYRMPTVFVLLIAFAWTSNQALAQEQHRLTKNEMIYIFGAADYMPKKWEAKKTHLLDNLPAYHGELKELLWETESASTARHILILLGTETK